MTHHSLLLAGVAALALAACQPLATDAPAEAPADAPVAAPVEAPASGVSAETAALYAATRDNGFDVPAIPASLLTEDKARQSVDYWTDHPPGTIIVDPHARRLYLVQPGDRAIRYTVGVGAAGFGFTGQAHTPYQRDWPRWTPTDDMLARNPDHYGPSADGVEGGPSNPMGARALYIHNSVGDTFYRIHGTPDPASVGTASSAGCIRLFNQDIIHLAERTRSMARVVVLTEAQSGMGTTPPGG
ncbi:L,D-transpeptidase [Paracoccus aestuarii]|uniref:L,D-transpeptidase n=1 Tax=Paracoccus aestuarii TaxID=453842 RepID=A0A418ZRH9_9RHOB|nr:L,D-transpeptidase [Paracoccus aestuarii]RJK97468.1 L,D-transpeptidase [Paracoccus aestuarii]WCR00925.1 L,D-transpeptidase [Paracoccus aestuarii]